MCARCRLFHLIYSEQHLGRLYRSYPLKTLGMVIALSVAHVTLIVTLIRPISAKKPRKVLILKGLPLFVTALPNL